MNSCLTAAANCLIFSGCSDFVDKKPILRPSIKRHTASRPNKFAISSKLFTSNVRGSLRLLSKSRKSSHTQLSAGRKFCKTLGDVIEAVKDDRNFCQMGPCLVHKSYFRLIYGSTVNLLINYAYAGIAIRLRTSIGDHNFSRRSKRIFAGIL